MKEHTHDYAFCDAEIGVVPDNYVPEGESTQMGGTQAIVCHITGGETSDVFRVLIGCCCAVDIESEDMECFPDPNKPKDPLTFRTPRMQSIESGVSRCFQCGNDSALTLRSMTVLYLCFVV